MKKIILILITLTGISFAQTGAELYNKCMGCHGTNGDKAALGKSAIITGQDKELTVKQLKGYKSGDLNQHGMGSLMKVQVNSLTDEDIENISEYISNMK